MTHINDLPMEILRKILANLDIPDGAMGIDDGAPYALDGPQVPNRPALQQSSLESATLVCHSWSKIAQCILFRILEVCYSAKPLLAVLQRRGDLAASVQILGVRPLTSSAQDLAPIPAVLRLLPNLQAYAHCPWRDALQAEHEYFPTNTYNSRLQYFGVSRLGSANHVLEMAPSTTAERPCFDLPHNLRRLDIRHVRLGPSKIPCLKRLTTLCIDSHSFGAMSRRVFEDCPGLKSLYLPDTPSFMAGASFSGIEYLCLRARSSQLLRKTFPNIKHLDLIDWTGEGSGEELAKELPLQLKGLTWTCMDVSGLPNAYMLLRQICTPSFLPALETIPEIYCSALQTPNVPNPLDGAVLELITQATKAFAKRKVSARKAPRRASPLHRFYDVKMFPIS